MKELVEVIATSLVDHPEEVVVTETVTDKSIVLELKVAPMIWERLLASRDVSRKQSVPLSNLQRLRMIRKSL